MVRMRRNCKNKKIFSYLALLFKLPFHHIILQDFCELERHKNCCDTHYSVWELAGAHLRRLCILYSV